MIWYVDSSVYIHLLNFTWEIPKAVLANFTNVLFFAYTRFYDFPKERLLLWSKMPLHLKTCPIILCTTCCLYVGSAFLLVFNITIMGELLLPKVV
jgi:hypothetical protein